MRRGRISFPPSYQPVVWVAILSTAFLVDKTPEMLPWYLLAGLLGLIVVILSLKTTTLAYDERGFAVITSRFGLERSRYYRWDQVTGIECEAYYFASKSAADEGIQRLYIPRLRVKVHEDDTVLAVLSAGENLSQAVELFNQYTNHLPYKLVPNGGYEAGEPKYVRAPRTESVRTPKRIVVRLPRVR